MPSDTNADPALALDQADEAMARFDIEALIVHLSAAVRGFTATGEPCAAAMACVRLGQAMTNFLGNQTAARAWFARAARLVEGQPACIEQGWVAVAAMGCDVDDPAVLLACSELALDRARQFGDLNLETKALADAGLAHVQAGRISEGMALLDESMALACGPADDTGAAAQSVCSFFTACYFAADFERAGTWADLLRRQGLIGPLPPGPAFLSNHCDSVQATLLMELGRWRDAEALLVRAKADFEAVMGTSSWHSDIALADLRVRQGRFADAETLLLGKEQAMQALLPAARLHLERGDHALALATAARGIRLMGDDRLRVAELLTVQVDALLATGEIEAAQAAAETLADRTSGLDIAALAARTDAVRARVLASAGDHEAAAAVVESAIDRLDVSAQPWLLATLQLEAARIHDRGGNASAATTAARAATALLATLDVVVSAADAHLLERLAATSGDDDDRRRSARPPATLTRGATWWAASFADTTVRVRHSKGLSYLAELLAVPGTERHALDLVDRIEGVGAVDRRSIGHAGEMLDGQARSAYRHRIELLRAEIEEALDADRLEAAEAMQGELDQLIGQLAQAFGLGGRSRVANSAAERARLNVTRAVRTAVDRLTEVLPEAGAALDRQVRTGIYCVYEPIDGEIRWIVQS